MGDLIALLLLAFGTALGALLLWKLFDMVRSSINKNKEAIPAEQFNRLARAFVEHKKEMTKRVQHLEAIIADSDHNTDKSLESIEAPDSEGSLTNELRQGKRMQS